jgi:hypothetical protein
MKRTFTTLLVLVISSPLLFAQPAVNTTRKSEIVLTAPKHDDTFSFVVFADRTTGPQEGLDVLADAIKETNQLRPAFVMNVGDMVQGYCGTERWLSQMHEYKAIMSKLESPWFPTAGNHDIYGGRETDTLPKGQNEINYETHFGPLWYAFEYKNNWFVVLFTDEGFSETGEKAFNRPECQVMSDEQFNWLKSVLDKAKNADGIYVFQHHPRWFGNRYGNDWDKVHDAFVKAGNVKIVFGGHIHTMTYNEKDGIRYMTLAATGGNLDRDATIADGSLHHINVVSVKKGSSPTVAALPVGTTIDAATMPIRRYNELNPTPRTPRTGTQPRDAVPVLTPQTAP